MHWKAHIKHVIPPALLNRFLLTFPILYRTSLVRYETNLFENRGVEELVDQLDHTLDLEGDIVECGSSRCGATVIMAEHLRRRGRRRKIYSCDSFEGFDLMELRRERVAGTTNASEAAFTSTSIEYVREKLRRLGVTEGVELVQGYFERTLPALVGPVSFSLIDCDLKDSMRFAAEQIWKRLVPGGRMVLDDYDCNDFAGARQAVDEFVLAHKDEIAEHYFMRRLYCIQKMSGGAVATA
jgi:SAM-dependent methyltransferase